MFSGKIKKSYAPKMTGKVEAGFYDAGYYLGAERKKSNWDDPYDWEHFGKLFKQWAVFFITGFPDAGNFLDVGCARGFLEKAFAELKIRNPLLETSIGGFDYSPWAIENAEPEVRPFISVASVENFHFVREYDVMLSLDTFEHLTDEQVTHFLLRSRKFIRDCGFFVIALDEERQRDEPSHVNLKDRVWWENKFSECGWIKDWEMKMLEALARKENFIKTCQVEIFIWRAHEENRIPTPYDEKLLELAQLEKWRTPKEEKHEA